MHSMHHVIPRLSVTRHQLLLTAPDVLFGQHTGPKRIPYERLLPVVALQG